MHSKLGLFNTIKCDKSFSWEGEVSSGGAKKILARTWLHILALAGFERRYPPLLAVVKRLLLEQYVRNIFTIVTHMNYQALAR